MINARRILEPLFSPTRSHQSNFYALRANVKSAVAMIDFLLNKVGMGNLWPEAQILCAAQGFCGTEKI